MTILTDTGCVPANLRLYLPLLMESLLQSSILRGQGNQIIQNQVQGHIYLFRIIY